MPRIETKTLKIEAEVRVPSYVGVDDLFNDLRLTLNSFADGTLRIIKLEVTPDDAP